jgi:hypothetical protein
MTVLVWVAVYPKRRAASEGGPYKAEDKSKNEDGSLKLTLGFDGAGSGVPGDGDVAAEAGLVHHMARECCVVAEDGIFG